MLKRSRLLNSRYLARSITAALVLLFATAQAIGQSIEERLSFLDLGAGNIGISITKLDGSPVVSYNSHTRFLPASSQKLLTTAAAFHFLGDFTNAGWPGGTVIALETSSQGGPADIRMIGTGDATLSSAPECETNCLTSLADAVIAAGYNEIGQILVDDSLFRPSHRPDGWSHEDLKFAYGSAISALAADRGMASAYIFAPVAGAEPQLIWKSEPAFAADISEVTTRAGPLELELEQQAGTPDARLYGNLPPGPSLDLEFGLDDPSLYAGKLFRRMLTERGAAITGPVAHANPRTNDRIEISRFKLPDPQPSDTLEAILHDSSNFDSEVLLQHISLSLSDKTPESGLWLLEHILLEAGAQESEFNVSDGSGLSVYNRISPDAMTRLLVWATGQEWYPVWSYFIASNGEDGTLKGRFTSSIMKNRIRAKTGSVFGTDALAGYFTAVSGETYAFAIIINDTALSHRQARAIIDKLITDYVMLL